MNVSSFDYNELFDRLVAYTVMYLVICEYTKNVEQEIDITRYILGKNDITIN